LPILDEAAMGQFSALERNCREAGITLFDMFSHNQGIVHVIGPELGITQPGQTIVCGDSHTSTHGAFGTLAFGIGTSEVEHVLATQCLSQYSSKTMRIVVNGSAPRVFRQKTSFSPSSEKSALPAARAVLWNILARPFARSRWTAA